MIQALTIPQSSSQKSLLFVRIRPIYMIETVVKLMGVANIIAHDQYGRLAAVYDDSSSAVCRFSGKRALFAYGSKVAHSCYANATYSSKTAYYTRSYPQSKRATSSLFPTLIATILFRPILDERTRPSLWQLRLCTGIDSTYLW